METSIAIFVSSFLKKCATLRIPTAEQQVGRDRSYPLIAHILAQAVLPTGNSIGASERLPMSTSIGESSDELSQSSPRILRIEKIVRRPSYDVDDDFDSASSKSMGGAVGDVATIGNHSKVLEKKSKVDQVLPADIRLRPDLRPLVKDEDIVQWRSISHPESTNMRLELQAKTIAAAEDVDAVKGAWDDNTLGNRTNNSPTSSAKETLEFLVGANRSRLVPEGINPEGLITPDVRSKMSQMSDEQRIHRLRIMRNHRAGTPPKAFHNYITELVGKARDTYSCVPNNASKLGQIPKSTRTKKGEEQKYQNDITFNDSLDEEHETINGAEDVMIIPPSKISARISYDPDGGFDESSKQSIIDSVSNKIEDDDDDDLSSTLSISRISSPNRAKSVPDGSEDRQIQVSRDGNLHLYHMNEPGPSSPQGAAYSQGGDAKPLYNEAAKYEAEIQARGEKDDQIVLAKTTLFSRDFPHRPDGEEYFTTEKPSSPHSPFDSKAERVRQLILYAEERRTASRQGVRTAGTTVGGKPSSRGDKRAKTSTGSPHKTELHTSTDISKNAIKCFSECKRNATLWCKDCALPFCPVCWVKVPHHSFVKSESVWDEMNIANTSTFKGRAKTALPETNNMSSNPIVISQNGFRSDIRTTPGYVDDASANSVGTVSTAGNSNITPSVYLDASGKIKRISAAQTVADKANNVNIVNTIPDMVNEHLAGGKSVVLDNVPTSNADDMSSVDLDRENYPDSMAKRLLHSGNSHSGSISFLSAMALQAHEHATRKKTSLNEIKFVGDSSDWKKFNATGKLPPIKYSQVDERVLERKKALKKWELLNRPGKLDVDPQKKLPVSPTRYTENPPLSTQRLGDSFVVDSSQTTMLSVDDTTETNVAKDKFDGENEVTRKKASATYQNAENSIRKSQVYDRKTPSIAYTATGGIGLGVGYKVNPEAQTIVGITKEKLFEHNFDMETMSIATPETSTSNMGRHISIINGVAVYTLPPPSDSSSEQQEKINPKDLYKINEKRRLKENKRKSRADFISGQKDEVLDTRNVQINPLLADIYGKDYLKWKVFKPYESVPPVQHVDLKKQKTVRKTMRKIKSENIISVVSEKMSQVMIEASDEGRKKN